MSEFKINVATHQLRAPCKFCGGADGILRTVSGQDTVRCFDCGKHLYNAPKTETGRASRTIKGTHRALSASVKARVIVRAGKRCELCNATDAVLHAGHMLSVKDAMGSVLAERLALTDAEINSDENLAAMCEDCNGGLGSETIPLRLAFAILKARTKHAR